MKADTFSLNTSDLRNISNAYAIVSVSSVLFDMNEAFSIILRTLIIYSLPMNNS